MKYAFTNGKIINGTKDMAVQEGLDILVDNKKIVAIQPKGDIPTGYKVINLNESYILPGLINMHVHLAGNGKPQKKQRDNEKLVNMIMSNPISKDVAYKLVSKYAKIELMSGVTTIRTVGGLVNFDTRLRDEINAVKRMGHVSSQLTKVSLYLMVIWPVLLPSLLIQHKKL